MKIRIADNTKGDKAFTGRYKRSKRKGEHELRSID